MGILITDQAGTSATETVDNLRDVEYVIRDWCPDAPADIEAAITELQDALGRGDDQKVYELTTLLAVTIEHVDNEREADVRLPLELFNPAAVFEVNNSTRVGEPYWQRITHVTAGCDAGTAEDYDCAGDCVVTLHLVPPEDGAAEVWHMTAEQAAVPNRFQQVR
jgi:hypothetical protein